MKVTIAACCADIIIDSQTNSVSLYNIFEEIVAEALPVFLPKFSVFLLIEKTDNEDGDQVGQLQLKDNNTLRSTHNVRYTFLPYKKSSRIIIKFNGMAVNHLGKLSLEFYDSKTELVQSIHLDVIPSSPQIKQEMP